MKLSLNFSALSSFLYFSLFKNKAKDFFLTVFHLSLLFLIIIVTFQIIKFSSLQVFKVNDLNP